MYTKNKATIPNRSYFLASRFPGCKSEPIGCNFVGLKMGKLRIGVLLLLLYGCEIHTIEKDMSKKNINELNRRGYVHKMDTEESFKELKGDPRVRKNGLQGYSGFANEKEMKLILKKIEEENKKK